MAVNYFKKNRENIFPEIKDFSVSVEKYKKIHPNDLNYKEWFWFHPSSYKMLSWGLNIIGILTSTIFIIFLNNLRIRIILLIFIIAYVVDFIKKYKQRNLTKDFTFYEMLVMD